MVSADRLYFSNATYHFYKFDEVSFKILFAYFWFVEIVNHSLFSINVGVNE